MKSNESEQYLKTFTLSVDEPHLSSIRNGEPVNYQAGDQIIISVTKNPTPGSLVLVIKGKENRLCRYEMIHGNRYLFPPLEIHPHLYKDVILGQLVEHVRISKWLTLEN